MSVHLFGQYHFRLWSVGVLLLDPCTDSYTDEQMFGSLQSIPAYIHQFGQEQADGTYALSTSRVSLITSIAYVGKCNFTRLCRAG